jgi:thioester reductase-like protein
VLLEDPQVQVKMLLRAGSADELADRLEGLFRFWAVGTDNEDFRQRVIGLAGDATLPRFDLSEADYRELMDSCTHVVHAAGNVRMNLSIAEARKSSLECARQIVLLARACPRLEKVEFVSTVGVGGRMPNVPEDWLTNTRVFHNTYEQSKAEAEDYLREQIEQDGLPATVHRPSMVVGDSNTGRIVHFQIFYYLCEFLSGRQTSGLLPMLRDTQLDTIPVDFVARAIYWSSTQAETVGRVLHLCSGPEKSMSIPSLTDALRRILVAHGHALPPLRQVPLWLFRGALPVIRSLSDQRRRKALDNLSLFLDYASDRQQFACSRTTSYLAPAGIVIPAPVDYLDKVVWTYLDSRKQTLDGFDKSKAEKKRSS